MTIQEDREQLFLELINRARMDPAGEAARYNLADLSAGTGTTITSAPKQVLAYNAQLFNSATAHNVWMITNDKFQHEGPGDNQPADRMVAAGYGTKVSANAYSFYGAENIGYSGTTGVVNGNAEVLSVHEGLFLSAGHRRSMLNNNYEEVGIAAQVENGYIGFNSLVATHNFGGKVTPAIYVTGVNYTDTDNNDFYSVGESNAGRTVQLLSGVIVLGTTTTANAGGYVLSTTALGAIEVVYSGAGLANDRGAIFTKAAGDDQNVKFDLTDGNTIETNVTATLTRNAANLTLLSINSVNGTGNALDNTLKGNKANNILDGAGGNDILNGGDGSDTLIGGAGHDTLMGGAGTDTARFTDALANYEITSAGPGLFTLTDADGFTDTATGIESFVFNGVTYSAAQLQSLAGAPKPVVSVAAVTPSLSEGHSGQTVFQFFVTLDSAALASQTVNFSVAGTGANAANAADFVSALSGSVTFAAGETSKTVQVLVAGDTLIETSETFAVTLSAPSSGINLGTASATATILTDDIARQVSVSATSTGRSEGNSGITTHVFVVSLDAASSASQSVNWAVAGSGSNATSASDFSGASSGTVVFAAGETSKTVRVAVLGDSIVEANETFDFTLLTPSLGLVLAGAMVTSTIINDDRGPNGPPYDYANPDGTSLDAAAGGYGSANCYDGNTPDVSDTSTVSNDWYSSGLGAHSNESHLF